jgi:Mob1/phocein family
MNGPETSTPYDRNLWLYELCRFLTIKANDVLVALFADNPPCTAQSCPEMRASEWQYLCAVHDPPKPCCAIDYCCHTLDWAGNVLSSPKYFASRLTMGEGGNAAASMRHLTNIFRRVYRIFAHAWFQHRGVFWQVEGRYGVYIFFKTVCDVYQLIPEDNYTIPAEAEGGNEEGRWEMKTPVSMPTSTVGQHKVQILTKDRNGHADDGESQVQSPGKQQQQQQQQQHEQESEATTTLSVGATTRRHKHTPSTGSHVTTIAEGTEEEDGNMFEHRNAEDDDEDLGGAQGPGPSILSEHEETQPHPQGQGLLSEGSLGVHGLAKLDLSPESLPELRAPEDPTPLASHTRDPMSDLVTTSAGALHGYSEEGKQEIEDKMAGLTVGGAKGEAAKDVEGEPDLNAEESEKDEDLEKLGKSVVQDSQEVNIGEAEREKKVEEGATVAPEA